MLQGSVDTPPRPTPEPLALRCLAAGQLDAETAVGVGEFNAEALLYSLVDAHYSRPLDEVRDLSWSAPRMPLLAGSDSDLQRAIFEAVVDGSLRLVGDDESERVVTKASEIGVGSASLHLPRPDTVSAAAVR